MAKPRKPKRRKSRELYLVDHNPAGLHLEVYLSKGQANSTVIHGTCLRTRCKVITFREVLPRLKKGKRR